MQLACSWTPLRRAAPRTVVDSIDRHACGNQCHGRFLVVPRALGLPEGADAFVSTGKQPNSAFVQPTRLVSSSSPAKLNEAAAEGSSSSAGGSSGTGFSATLPQTVYTLRLSTGWRSGSALLDPGAGVQVALVAMDGTTLLHRVCPINDPLRNERDLREMCEVIANQEDVGANCPVALKTALTRNAKQRITRRFQEGSVDEVCFLGPELGPLAGVLVGPEAGRWLLDEVVVSSSRRGPDRSDRFVCRELLGDKGARPAAWLTPVPEDAVVYGSGESAVVLTKDQAATMRSLGLAEYDELKGRLMMTTISLVTTGTFATFALGGLPLAAPFAGGGVLGLVYQWMLQRGVDSLPAGGATVEEEREAASNSGPLSSGPFRLVVLLGMGCGLWLGQQLMLQAALGQQAAEVVSDAHKLAAIMMGFLMYKAAVVGVTAVPSSFTRDRQTADGATR